MNSTASIRLLLLAAFCFSVSTPLQAGPAEDEKLIGLWKSDHGCVVHIFVDKAGALAGAAWGARKESSELTIKFSGDRRFAWKRNTKKLSFGEDGEVDPKRSGRFIVDSNDRAVLYSNHWPCYYPRGRPAAKFVRVSAGEVSKLKVPGWYSARFAEVMEGEVIAKAVQPKESQPVEAPQETRIAKSENNPDKGGQASQEPKSTGLGGLLNTLESFDQALQGQVTNQLPESGSGQKKSSTSATPASSSEKIWCATRQAVSRSPHSDCLTNGGKVFKRQAQAQAEHRRLKGGTASTTEEPSPESTASQVVTVAVQSNVSGARVSFSGIFKGLTDLSVELPKNIYQLEVEKEGFISYRQLVEIVESTTLHIKLQQDGASTTGSARALGKDWDHPLCKGGERICPPDPSKTLFVEIAAKRGLIPDTSGCDTGCDDCETDFDELAEKAGNQDKLKLFLSGRCLRCDLSNLDMRDVDLSPASQFIRCSQTSAPNNLACGSAMPDLFDVRGSNLQGADFSGFHARASTTFPRAERHGDLEVGHVGGLKSFAKGDCQKNYKKSDWWKDERRKKVADPDYELPLKIAETDLTNANFDRSDLRGTGFTRLKTVGARFTSADLRGTSFRCSNMADTNFAGSDLRRITFGRWDAAGGSNAIGHGLWASGSEFTSQGGFDVFDELSVVDLSGADFGDSNLGQAFFGYVALESGDFSNADLRQAMFGVTDLTEANFTGADLRGAVFEYVDLTGAIFDGAILDKATMFKHADLSNARLDKAKIDGTDFSEATLCETMTPWGQDDAGCG